MLKLKYKRLASLCFSLSVASVLTFSARADTLCGPAAYSSEYISAEYPEDNSFDSLGGSSVRLHNIPKGSENSQLNTALLERFDTNGVLQSLASFDAEKQQWSIAGEFSSQKLLVVAAGNDEVHLKVITYDGHLEWSQDVTKKNHANIHDTGVSLLKGTKLLFSNGSVDSDKAIIAEVSEKSGITSFVQFEDDRYRYPNHAVQLADGSIAITSNGMTKKLGSFYSTAGVTMLNVDRSVRWQKQYTNGFDDELNQIMQLSNGNLLAAGTSDRINRYDGGDEAFWLVEIDEAGQLVNQQFLFEPAGSVLTGLEKFYRDRSGRIFIEWGVQGLEMNDHEHQKCTFLIK